MSSSFVLANYFSFHADLNRLSLYSRRLNFLRRPSKKTTPLHRANDREPPPRAQGALVPQYIILFLTDCGLLLCPYVNTKL